MENTGSIVLILEMNIIIIIIKRFVNYGTERKLQSNVEQFIGTNTPSKQKNAK